MSDTPSKRSRQSDTSSIRRQALTQGAASFLSGMLEREMKPAYDEASDRETMASQKGSEAMAFARNKPVGRMVKRGAWPNNTMHVCSVQRPASEEDGLHIVMGSMTVDGKSVETRVAYYEEEQDYEELKDSASVLEKNLHYTDAARGVVKTLPGEWEAAKMAQAEVLSERGLASRNSQAFSVEGLVRMTNPDDKDSKSVTIGYDTSRLPEPQSPLTFIFDNGVLSEVGRDNDSSAPADDGLSWDGAD